MEIEISGQSARVAGAENTILAAVVAALEANGATVSRSPGEGAP